MFKVECPGCNAPYQVDERRVPASGLKMRCPKCGTSFMVDPPTEISHVGPSPVLGAALAAPPAPSDAPPPSRRRQHKATMLGVAPSALGAGSEPPVAEPQAEAADPFGELDLPAVTTERSAAVRTAPESPAARAQAELSPQTNERQPPRPELDEFGEVDLPMLGGTKGAVAQTRASAPIEPDFPAAHAFVSPKVNPSTVEDEFGELDLPSAAPADPFELDLPSPAKAPAAVAAHRPEMDRGLDLPSLPDARPKQPPSPLMPEPAKHTGDAFGEIDLPTAAGAADLNLKGGSDAAEWDFPSPGKVAKLPQAGRNVRGNATMDLPSPTQDLPSPSAHKGYGIDLPAPAVGLPSPSFDLPSPSFELPSPAIDLPTSGKRRQNLADLPGHGDLPSVPEPGLPDVGAGLPSIGDLPSLPPDRHAAASASAGEGYGDLAFDAGSPGASLETASITGRPEPAAAQAVAPRAGVALPGVAIELPRRKRRGWRVALVLFVLIAGAGGALALVPELGPYGVYWVADQVNENENAALVERTVSTARTHMSRDTSQHAASASEAIAAARQQAKRVKALPAYGAFVAFLRQLRFGSNAELYANGKVLLDELSDKGHVVHMDLARAAQAAVDGQLARARQWTAARTRSNARDIDALVLRGELELKARDPKAALAAWQAAAAVEKSGRTWFGLARAHYAAGDRGAAEQMAKSAIELSPEHTGARLLVAELVWETNEDEATATKLLEEILSKPGQVSENETVSAQTLLGDIHLERSRISAAETAYTEALKLDARAARALRGLGDALYLAGRFSEALARYEAAIQADPDDLASKVGAAKTKLALERPDDASAMLDKLRQAHQGSMLVAYWAARAHEALGHREKAEAAYRDAIQLGRDAPAVVDAYIGLAMLLNQQGRTEEAQQALAQAREKLPTLPSIHKAMGQLMLAQGKYSQAIEEFQSALQIDAKDVSAKFGLAVALRRDRQFDRATKVFDEVGEIDRDHPGLALERGQLYEESGRSEEALKAYETALAKAPTDPDLMLRVGCGKAAAGRGKEAADMLRKVLTNRPNSAETNYCLGRALLAEGKNLGEAVRSLERAVEIDPHRAEYHLYVGWAANEAGQVSKAEGSLGRAIELDQGLADAYWQRGVLRARQSAFKDAIADLQKALELRPSRYEVHAAIADAYYELGREPDALVHWNKAVTAEPNNAVWQFRYGKLLVANDRVGPAREHLAKAIEVGEQMPTKPAWLWEAHHNMARAIGSRPEAVKHWEQFLKQAPADSPYRSEAIRELRKFGKSWTD